MVVKGIYDSGCDECCRLYYGGGLYEEVVSNISQIKVYCLSRKNEKNLEVLFEELLVEYFLCKQDVNGIIGVIVCCSYYGDDGMFFDVEWVRVESKFVFKDLESYFRYEFGLCIVYWVGNQLDDGRSDDDG